MRIVRIHETLPQGGVIRLHHVTDMHVGAPDFDEAGFLERRKLIEADPNARWVFGGDGGDLIRFNDKRYQPSELHPRYRQATDIRYASLEHLQELFEPIKAKCWGFADGNHEAKVDAHDGGKFGVELCCNLGIEHLWVGYSGFVNVTFQRANSTQRLSQLIDLHHGWQAGRTRGSFHNQAEKELSMTEADIVLRGHSHKPDKAIFKTVGVSSDLGRAVFRFRTVINGGCWRTGYLDSLAPVNRDKLSEVESEMWSERKGFRHEHVGGPVLRIKADFGHSAKRPTSSAQPAIVEHTVIDGRIDADALGL